MASPSCSDEQDRALHDRVVARQDGLKQHPPQARVIEDRLGDDGPAHEGAEL
jgi:hypothetical protein